MNEEKQNEKTTNKKEGKKLKILVCTLITILIAMIAIFGVYTQYQNRMQNNVKGYAYGMDLIGERTILLSPSTGTEEKITDANGNEVTDADDLTDEELAEKGYTKEEIKTNTDEEMNKENFQKSKEIIEKRLKQLSVAQYTINVNEENGQIIINIPENTDTESIINDIIPIGKFEIIDSETKEVLMNNNHIKEAKVMYGQNSSQGGTNVYLTIEFNKEGKAKFEEITNTYKTIEETDTENTNTTSEDTNSSTEENNTTENSTTNNTTSETEATDTAENAESEETEKQKEVILQIDGEQLMTTSFDEVVTTGEMSLVVGQATTDEEQIQTYASNALDMATLIGNGEIPIEYEGYSQYIQSDITKEELHIIEIAIISIAAIALLILIIRHKTNGFLASISYVGLAAIFALIIRYTNVTVAIEGIFAIAIILIINYIFQNKLLAKVKELKEKKESAIVGKAMKETYKDFFIKIIPICIMAIAFCFINWTPISSFGMIMFWGLLLIAVYNPLITQYLLKIENKE